MKTDKEIADKVRKFKEDYESITGQLARTREYHEGRYKILCAILED